ncbi:MAG: autotransporter-associated beta strand repeat-containing protein [Verrucomicrobiota bacterium]
MKNPQSPLRSLGGFARYLITLRPAVAAVGAALLSQAAFATSSLPFYEPFPTAYTENGNLGAAPSLTVWDFGNSASSSSGRTATVAAQGYPGLTTDTAASKGIMSRPAGTGAKDRGASLTIPSGVTLYASFLFNIQTTNLVTSRFFGLSPTLSGTSVSANGAVIYLDTQRRLSVAKNSATPALTNTYALSTNTTYLVVLRYKYNTGSSADDSVDLWLNPTSLGNNAAVPAPILSTTNNNDVAVFNSVAYFQNNAVANAGVGLYYIDEIRVSTNWADVTPTNCSPGATFAVTGGGTACAGSGFPVGLAGSEAGVDYLLFTNGVYSATVAGTGSAISFGSQTATANYSVLASNTVSTCVGWMNGSVAVANLAAPSIVTQPSAITVASGGAGTITVTAGGDGLSYQWRKNGVNLSNGGHYAGVTTASLTIYPADGTDAATSVNGYDVVVSGSCSPAATSSRVGLTIKTPADLIWVGDGAANLWDIATSLNWNDGVNTTNFNFGDNVVFDDTSANTSVGLASPLLSPTQIRVDSTQNYIFRPGGNISGPGTSLLKTGTGILYMTNNVNSYAGGTTISNGIIAFNNGTAFGSGTITMAGGILDTFNALASVANNVQVTADSIIDVRNTSGSALTLNGDLAGTGGTLTFSNASTAGPTIQLTHTNISFSRPIDIAVGAGTTLIVAGNNTGGSQMFNGVISGLQGMISRNGGNGVTILNGANTYSGGTWLQNGTIGVGISSVSTVPPTVDSGALGTGPLTINSGGASVGMYASGGARTVDNPINYTNTVTGSPWIISGSNDLTFTGVVDFFAGDRTLQVDNTGKTVFAGDIGNGGLIKTGSGTLYLNGNNSYSNPTIVSNGALGGIGTIAGPVVIMPGASLAPGASVGTLTINNDLTINGNLAIEVNKSLSPSNDVVTVSGVLTNGGTGTLTVANLGAALAIGNKFTVFSQPLLNGNAMTVTGGGATWANNLAGDGSITVTGLVSTQPPLITSTVIAGGNIVINGTNGTAGSGYSVYSSTSLTTPRASWTLETSGTFGAGGGFSVSIPVSSATPAKFYLLKLP